jgi:transglutaminase-like putative cysteine protease
MRITADGVINDHGFIEPVVPQAMQHPVESLPEQTLVYLLSSRYCDTEHLSAIAWNLFGNATSGWARVQSICDFVHRHITFGYQFARPTKTAS